MPFRKTKSLGQPSGGGGGAVAIAGEMKMFAGSSAPVGWLLCNGAAVSRTTEADLFLNIGVAYGIGNGSTTFNIPDMRSRIPIGVGTGAGLSAYALGDSGGSESTTDVPEHNHTFNVESADGTDGTATPSHKLSSTMKDINEDDINAWLSNSAGADITLHTSTIGDTGVSSVDIRQPFLGVNFIIKL